MSKKTDQTEALAKNYDSFARRHIGISEERSLKMLDDLGFNSMDNFIQSIVPESIYSNKDLKIDEWFFKVHWKNDPNVPGMLQIESLVQMSALSILSLPGNKGKVVYLISADKLKV